MRSAIPDPSSERSTRTTIRSTSSPSHQYPSRQRSRSWGSDSSRSSHSRGASVAPVPRGTTLLPGVRTESTWGLRSRPVDPRCPDIRGIRASAPDSRRFATCRRPCLADRHTAGRAQSLSTHVIDKVTRAGKVFDDRPPRNDSPRHPPLGQNVFTKMRRNPSADEATRARPAHRLLPVDAGGPLVPAVRRVPCRPLP